jgi:hypothetical protein
MRRFRNLLPALLALILVGALVAYINGWLPPLPSVFPGKSLSPATPVVPETPAPEATLTPSARVTTPRTSSPSPLPAFSPVGSPAGPVTPADDWANTLLDLLLPQLKDVPLPTDGLAWWQNSNAIGEITFTDGALVLDQRKLDIARMASVGFFVPDPFNPNQLVKLGGITTNQGTLVLSVLGSSTAKTDMYWLLSSADPALALGALVTQADARDLALTVAVAPGADAELQVALLGAETPEDRIPTPTPLPPDFPTLTPSRTPTPTATTTPTREPDPYLMRVMAEKIDPVIDVAERFHPSAVFRITTQHPRTGLLTWTEAGAQIGSYPTAVAHATELSFYALEPDDPDGVTTRLFTVFYAEGTTRFPEDKIYFQGQRMEEMLFWLVRRAAERGGQLYVAYDDLGTSQALIIIGFRFFTTPAPAL